MRLFFTSIFSLQRLYEQNNRRLPMPVAQIGNAFRNEIAPRAGVLRVRSVYEI